MTCGDFPAFVTKVPIAIRLHGTFQIDVE